MKKILIIALLSLALAIPAMAQTPAKPADPLPTVDQILDKYVQAIGGKAAIEKITSRVAKGTVEVSGVGASGPIEIYAKAPDKIASFVSLSGVGQFTRVYDGKMGWSSDPFQGLRELSGAEFAALKRGADVHRDLKIKEGFSKMTVKGKEKVGDREAYVIEAVSSETGPEKLFFDVQSGLIVRRDVEVEGPDGKVATENYIEDYREVDGLKIPFSQRQVLPQYTVIIKLEEVKHNVAVDEAKFNKPAAS